jgi:hypothetical protein
MVIVYVEGIDHLGSFIFQHAIEMPFSQAWPSSLGRSDVVAELFDRFNLFFQELLF